jgi:NAD(P) transhydrogenase subunit beta
MPTLNTFFSVDSQPTIGNFGILVSLLLVYGLWRISTPATAAHGIRVAGAAMLIATLAGCLFVIGINGASAPHLPVNAVLAAVAVALGGGVAWWRANRAQMTSLPRLMAMLNALGAAAAVAISQFELFAHTAGGPLWLGALLLAALLGAMSCSASLVAWGKLGGRMNYNLKLSARPAFIGATLVAAIALGYHIVFGTESGTAALLSLAELSGVFIGCGLLCGLLMTLPAGASDMPTAVSLDNAATGAAVALLGLVLKIPALVVGGMLVAGAGALLSKLMAKAMNRSVAKALLYSVYAARGSLRTLDAADAGIFMRYARKVVIVPGFGLAAAQAQNKLRELIDLLLTAGVDVKIAEHPLAGRMPGQMEVILAEAGVADDLVVRVADADAEIKSADVVLVVGANDVTNPAASGTKSLPLFGMPILNVGSAKKLYVIKRSAAGRGYANIVNPTLYGENCSLIYGDAQIVLGKIVEAMRATEFPLAA